MKSNKEEENASVSEAPQSVVSEWDNLPVCIPVVVKPPAPLPVNKAEAYLQGLLWTVFMFKSGQCPDYYYNYPFGKAPSKQELLAYLKTTKGIKLRMDDAAPPHPIVSAASILPVECKHFVLKPYQPLFDMAAQGYQIKELGIALQQIRDFYQAIGKPLPTRSQNAFYISGQNVLPHPFTPPNVSFSSFKIHRPMSTSPLILAKVKK